MVVPSPITMGLKRVKTELGQSKGILVRLINGNYYVYRQAREKKVRVINEYLGRITEDGTFIKKKLKENGSGQDNLLKPDTELPSADFLDDIDKKILVTLSMNARITYSMLKNITLAPIPTIAYRVRRLEKRFGIKYTAEINVNKLGFSKYLVFVKFLDTVPSAMMMTEAMKAEPRVQVAFQTKGKYDLIFYCLAEDNDALTYALDRVRKNPGISDYLSEGYVTPFEEDYGFLPLRDSFFEVLEKRVWHRTKGTTKPMRTDLMQRDFAVLKEFNKDSTIDFSAIDDDYSFPKGSAQHAYADLLSEDRGILRRATLDIRGLDERYGSIVIAAILNKRKFIETQNQLRKLIINNGNRLFNKFKFVADIETPDGLLLILPVFNVGDLEKIEAELNDTIHGVNAFSLIIADVLIGNMNNRLFDNNYSLQFRNLVKNKVLPATEIVQYY